MKDPRTRRALLLAAVAGCLALSLFLVVLAVDVVRSRDALASGDNRYSTAPRDGKLWKPGALSVSAVSRDVLGVDDDLRFREAVRALRLSQRDKPTDSSPEAILRRAKAQKLLQDVAENDSDPARRSRAMSLLSVLLLSTPAADQDERASIQRAALANLQKAIKLDPANDEAKYNLEVVLRRRAGVQTVQGGPTPNPSSGQGDSRGAATGPPGKGY
ncbi:hypothetical protein [Gaiella sp.]|jgi:hypothetical protein|uniref:hypothetical protein n=1 Tax=Gaiella sp. TaxID=2663207 RepID=UPI002E325D6B|nr:hypothetical protein [Gaiella sp.]HEX5584371.1 hypothetical protein [Gaiella sp.]